MEIKILHKKENVLLNRTEIEADIEHFKEPTPTRAQVKEKLAAMLSADKDLIVIKKLEQTFGSVTKCSAVLYKSRADLESSEQEHLLKRGVKKKEEAKPEEKPAEAPKEEPKPKKKPAEEKKEEAPKGEAKPEEKVGEKKEGG